MSPNRHVVATRLLLDSPDSATQEFTLSKATVKVGRAPTNDVVVHDPLVSRVHVRFDFTSAGWEVTDLASANGVRINGTVVERAILTPGDRLSLGSSTLRLEADPLDPSATPSQAIGSDTAAAERSARLPIRLQDTTVPRVAVSMVDATWEVPMRGDALTVGRGSECDILLDSGLVSRQHAVFERRGDEVLIRDLRSRNGTFVRGVCVDSVVLRDGESVDIGPARLIFKRPFQDHDLTFMRSGPTHAAQRSAVVVVPGFGGSTLWRGSEQVWPAPRMVLTHPEALDLDQPLEARSLVNEVVIVQNLLKQDQYNALTDYLVDSLEYERGNDLLEFAYDFRQDNRLSARRLASAIDRWKVDAPITIVAHSMGCLVARYYVERLGGQKRVARVIHMGGPHAGTPYAFASLLQGPDLLPLGLLNAKLRNVLAGYPSWYQILPTYPFVSDRRAHFSVLDEDTWVADEHRHLVRNAHRFRAELATAATVPSVCVFGYGLKTITAARVEREEGSPCRGASFESTTQGDGMIPEHSGVLAGAEIHPVKQHHGSLYSDPDVKMRLKLELTRGVHS